MQRIVILYTTMHHNSETKEITFKVNTKIYNIINTVKYVDGSIIYELEKGKYISIDGNKVELYGKSGYLHLINKYRVIN